MSKNANKPLDTSWEIWVEAEDENGDPVLDENGKPVMVNAGGDLVEGVDVRTRVKDCWEICNGDLSIMPQNNPMALCVDNPDYQPNYQQKNKVIWGNDSGSEREAGAAFVNDPEKWMQCVEFTLDSTTKVWLGLGKDENSGDGYWHAYANIKLEKVVDAGVGSVIEDVNAPVEYYNLQGMRLANPAKGQIIIVKKGNNVTKSIF